MLMDVALYKQGTFLRIQATGNILCQLSLGTAAEVSRILAHGYGMEICHEIIAVELIDHLIPVLHRTEIISKVKIPGRLDSG
jgi:hypothetical protein